MRITGRNLLRLVLVAFASALSLAPATALADGAATQTVVTVKQTLSIVFTDPCTGVISPVTIVETEVFHITSRPVNGIQVVINDEGTFQSATSSGHFVAVNSFAGGSKHRVHDRPCRAGEGFGRFAGHDSPTRT
jgi:hypothetical protein